MSPRELPGRVIRGRIGVGTCLRSNSFFFFFSPNNSLLTAGHYLIINTTFGSHIVCWRLFKVLDGRRKNGGIYNLGWAATRTDSQAPSYKVGSLRTLASGTILDFKIPISAAGRYFLAGRCLAGLKNRFPNSVHIFWETHMFERSLEAAAGTKSSV